MAESFEAWREVLARIRLAVEPSELHGSLTGFLCAGWGGQPHELLAGLALDVPEGNGRHELDALIGGAAQTISTALQRGLPVELLLPAGPLAARANAAVEWARGFLGGLGLTGLAGDATQSPAAREVLANFGQIAAAHLECEDGDAAVLDEVLDYLRAGVHTLHTAYAPGGAA